MRKSILLLLAALICPLFTISAQDNFPEVYNPVWQTQSENSSGSMPLGGGDIGLNVWVEDGDVLFYFSRSGTFDENNELLKLGRIRVKFSPNPFNGKYFRQELVLKDGYMLIEGDDQGIEAGLKIWVDVYNPVIHVEAVADKALEMEVIYENWRTEDKSFRNGESFANSYKWERREDVLKRADSIDFLGNSILFVHRNRDYTVFDATLKQQALYDYRDRIPDPLGGLTFGGKVSGSGLVVGSTAEGTYLDTDYKSWSLRSEKPSKKPGFSIFLHTEQTASTEAWLKELKVAEDAGVINNKKAASLTREWWNSYWERSFIVIEPGNMDTENIAWQVGKNYQLFRYMLGCNAYGSYPTKFNGGLFTYDPRFTNPSRAFTPDFRNWGGGTFTAQNQRLVYFPMLKSGDFDMMKPQFDFYKRILEVGELRSKVYWGHGGACFTEQIENFGLPNRAEYGLNRPDGYDPGLEYNAWLEHQWDTALEFCLMILNRYEYNGDDPSEYLGLILSVLRFFDEHYQYLASQRGREKLDADGHLVLYPGSGCETYKMAYNATSTVAGLKTVIEHTLDLPAGLLSSENRTYLEGLLERIPGLEYRDMEGKIMIAPARSWERVNNTEASQLYPVYPWGIFGLGKPGLDTAVNTYLYDPDVQAFRNHISWKQYNIFAARLGLSDEAWHFTSLKLKDSGRRFPAFWGPGFDWVPDHNWGGSGMIGLQEMLLQTVGEKIILFPAWPEDIDVHFKLHAPGNTVVEAKWIDGRGEILNVWPENRRKDVMIGL